MIKLKPIDTDPKDEEALKKEVIRLLEEEFFAPLLRIVGIKSVKQIKNAKEDLISAIRSGKIVYSRGKFRGKFDSTLTRELRGLRAEWDRRHEGWAIPLSELPMSVRVEVGLATARIEEKTKKFVDALSKFDTEKIAEKLKAKGLFDASLTKTQKKVKRSLSVIGVEPELSEDQKNLIATEYTTNLQKNIKGWLDEEIVRMRTKVQELTMSGIRYENLVQPLKDAYGVSLEKATFWARQENNLMVAKYRESRMKDAGVETYEWRTVAGSPLHPVRDSHKALDGKIFSWDNPPITTAPGKTQRRNHPGEDYNCRCIAIPVIE
jgi:SPP1 gp7 family putative phage head morphogenesis protein